MLLFASLIRLIIYIEPVDICTAKSGNTVRKAFCRTHVLDECFSGAVVTDNVMALIKTQRSFFDVMMIMESRHFWKSRGAWHHP